MHAREQSVIEYTGDDEDPLAELAHVCACLDDPANRVEWRDVGATMAAYPEDVPALVAINRKLDAVLDDVVFVQKLLIAGLPNGYFGGDWGIFANHAVIRLLEEHSYRFIGLGAAFLGFVRDAELGREQARALVDDLVYLYRQSGPPEAWAELWAVVQTSPYLLLGYIDTFGADLEI